MEVNAKEMEMSKLSDVNRIKECISIFQILEQISVCTLLQQQP
jgi:hypothetical protein